MIQSNTEETFGHCVWEAQTFCGYYTADEFSAVLASFIRDGYACGERTLVVHPPMYDADALRQHLGAHLTDAERAHLVCAPDHAAVDSDALLRWLTAEHCRAQADGVRGIRCCIDITACAEDASTMAKVMDAQTGRLLCTHDLSASSAPAALAALANHDHALLCIEGRWHSFNRATQQTPTCCEHRLARPPRTDASLAEGPVREQIADVELESLIHQWRTTLDAVNDAIMLVNLDGEILRCNAAMAQFVQRPFQEMIGQRCYELVHGLTTNAPKCPLKRLVAGEVTEPMVVQRNGRDYEVRVDPLLDADNQIIGGVHIFTDITKRERTRKQILRYQGQLRSLAAQLSLTEQRERERLATELHETLGQMLAFTKLKLDCAGAKPFAPDIIETLQEVRELISQAIRYTRSLTFELSPPFLAELGLFAAAEWLAESFTAQHGLVITVTGVQGALPITDDVRGLLFRAVRELLINVIKHARAQSATVNIASDAAAVTVTVTDNGTGFDLNEAEHSFAGKGKYGLFNLRERLTSLGGDTRIITQPGHGTQIILVTPVSHAFSKTKGLAP